MEVSVLRPHGIKRKLIMSPAVAVETAGDYLIAHFPHGATIRGIWFIPTVALGTADSVIDIGIAKDGKTVIDGLTLAFSTSAVGTAVDVFQTKGTTGGVTVVSAGVSLWVQSDGGSTNGTGHFVVEYEDENN